MLRTLIIKNLILIECAEIHFDAGLNIFTGETGAGKSAILTAIRLLCGERSDVEWIRSSASSAVIEAKISSAHPFFLKNLDFPPLGEPVSVRREIHRSGKSRSFIEDQLVSSTELREFMKTHIEVLDQKTAVSLCNSQEQRGALDAFGGWEKTLKDLEVCVEKSRKAKEELEKFNATKIHQERDLAWAKEALQIFAEGHWEKGEEEALSAAHTTLSHAQELIEHTSEAAEGLVRCRDQIAPLFHTIEKSARLDPRLEISGQTLKTIALEIEEVESFLRSYTEQLDPDPLRLAAQEKRIHEIEKLKRRFGSTWDEAEKQRLQFLSTVETIASSEETSLALEKTRKNLEDQCNHLAEALSKERKTKAPLLSESIQTELRSLNLPHVRFLIEIQNRPLSSNGIDEVVFLFAANPGAKLLPLTDCASGGELARVKLAVKIVLAEKDAVGCLVFDEIDSHIGGRTASMLGEKLGQIAQKRQVICVTHFVQVAKLAQSHFGVVKKEKEGTASTSVALLDHEMREKEFHRMVGNAQ